VRTGWGNPHVDLLHQTIDNIIGPIAVQCLWQYTQDQTQLLHNNMQSQQTTAYTVIDTTDPNLTMSCVHSMCSEGNDVSLVAITHTPYLHHTVNTAPQTEEVCIQRACLGRLFRCFVCWQSWQEAYCGSAKSAIPVASVPQYGGYYSPLDPLIQTSVLQAPHWSEHMHASETK
jgi:hypothetical protein